MTKTRTTSRFIALLLTMLTIMSAVFAFEDNSVSALASLSAQGKAAMAELLKEDISSNSAINKYLEDGGNATLASKFKVPLKSNNGEIYQSGIQIFKIESGNFTFNGKIKNGFEDIDDSNFQQALINEFAKLMANKYRKRFSDADRSSIYNEIKDNCGQANASMVAALFQDTKADMFSALRIFQPFNGVIGTLLGICVLALIILLIGSTALDMAYINFPIARNFMYGKEKEGGDKGGAKKPWGVTADAWSVVNECEGGGGSGGDSGYKNANIAYFKRRIITYIVVAIMILYLLSGQLAGLIGWLMNLVTGFSLS